MLELALALKYRCSLDRESNSGWYFVNESRKEEEDILPSSLILYRITLKNKSLEGHRNVFRFPNIQRSTYAFIGNLISAFLPSFLK